MMTTFNGIKACVFDAYGTLFDVHSAVGKHRERLGDNADRLSAQWRTKQLEYTWLRSLMRQHVDFWQVTGDALDYAFAAASIDDPALRNDLMDAYLELDCYPEVPEVLKTLKDRGYLVAVLSNGSPKMLQAAIDQSKLSHLIDHSISVEEVGIFKPDPRVYQLAVDKMALDAPYQISFQSSNAWDAVGATCFGFRVAWINRFQQAHERLGFTPDAELKTLSQLPPMLVD